ncbi:hypothetical protein BZG36_00049 [Bifiguratus adelaidae]|uniref:Uncharacterized protein n=1 Tax=Bifiguratus adelaidae TaxID=1938954 RepID=A0A261Y8B2_9FUNG|nr:hypothetical protein BZG36_00049 [Bifiguratus adelaidae]
MEEATKAHGMVTTRNGHPATAHRDVCAQLSGVLFISPTKADVAVRAILCVLVITGADLGNRVTEENWGNAAWSFAASTIVFYLIGIIFATPHTFNDMDELNIRPSIYMPSPMRLNIVLFSLTLIPLIINHTLSTLAGSAYEAGDLNGYSRMVAGVYIMWGAVAFIIMLLYVVFGRQLLTILSKNMVGLEQHVPFRGAMESKTGLTQASRMRELRASYRKIKGVVITMIIMMPVITLVCVVLAILRARILSNVGVMIAFSCLWVNACGIAIGIALIFMGYGK